jgi:hypothetical protein
MAAAQPRDHVPLRDHFEVRLSSLEERFKDYMERSNRAQEELSESLDKTADGARYSLEKAVAEARYGLEKEARALDTRLNQMNEFRQQITNERGNYVSRAELGLQIQALKAELKPLQVQSDRFAGGYVALAAILAFLLSIAGFVFGLLRRP